VADSFFQSGIHPVLYTFFTAEGALDHDAMRAQVDWTLDQGAHGLVTHGLASEVAKLDLDERREVLDVLLSHVAGRAPVAVTVSEPSARGQIAFARRAVEAGAAWIIVQPPQVRLPEPRLADFVAEVAGAVEVPVAVQSNPANMEVSLSNRTLLDLHRRCPNITLLKAEGPATGLAELTANSPMAVFGGRNGLELVSSLRAGAAGNVPAPEFTPELLRVYALATSGETGALAQARQLHARLLPAITLINHNLFTQTTLGKQALAWRMGLGEVAHRAPAQTPGAFALEELRALLALAGIELPGPDAR
jgi:4-hydroxy-tetrahydrodipicolinate synthase